MTLKLLAVGDLHLGRLPSRLPARFAGAERAGLGPAGAWERVVDAAVQESVHAVALAGDVVEQEHDFFEGYRELHRGIARLLAAGIRTLAVAGNHDVQVLPHLARQLAGFELLGAGGTWQQITLAAGAERLTIHGWSFPQQKVASSPLAGTRLERGPGINLGLLHCDRDQPGSVYAPVRSTELNAAGLDGWLLGHIHAPDVLSEQNPNGYLGSVTGLDVAEAGPHGPWLLEIADGRLAAVTQWPLAPLHWEHLDVSLDNLTEPEQARERLLARIEQLNGQLLARRWPPRAVGLRVTFTGRTDRTRPVEELLREEDLSDIPVGNGAIHYFVERLRYATLPLVDLADLARHTDPPGLLARRLEVLGRSPADAQRQQLLAAAKAQIKTRGAQAPWQGFPDAETVEDAQVADWLQQAGLLMLERMLADSEPLS